MRMKTEAALIGALMAIVAAEAIQAMAAAIARLF